MTCGFQDVFKYFFFFQPIEVGIPSIPLIFKKIHRWIMIFPFVYFSHTFIFTHSLWWYSLIFMPILDAKNPVKSPSWPLKSSSIIFGPNPRSACFTQLWRSRRRPLGRTFLWLPGLPMEPMAFSPKKRQPPEIQDGDGNITTADDFLWQKIPSGNLT